MERRRVWMVLAAAALLLIAALAWTGMQRAARNEAQQQAWLDGFALGTYTAAQSGQASAAAEGARTVAPAAAAPAQAAQPAAPQPADGWQGKDWHGHGPGFFGTVLKVFFWIFLFMAISRLVRWKVARHAHHWGGPSMAAAGAPWQHGPWQHGPWQHGPWQHGPGQQRHAGHGCGWKSAPSSPPPPAAEWQAPAAPQTTPTGPVVNL